jgi:hypothetical protein
MMIEVELHEWEQQCCGDPFRIGSTVTWKLVARDPDEDSGRPMPGYWEEHHDQTPEHVPHLPVTGTVRTIRALHYAFDEGANPGEMIIRPSSEVAVELDGVPGAGKQLPGCTREHRVLAYRVQLEVAEGTLLPEYVADDQDDWFEQE